MQNTTYLNIFWVAAFVTWLSVSMKLFFSGLGLCKCWESGNMQGYECVRAWRPAVSEK